MWEQFVDNAPVNEINTLWVCIEKLLVAVKLLLIFEFYASFFDSKLFRSPVKLFPRYAK